MEVQKWVKRLPRCHLCDRCCKITLEAIKRDYLLHSDFQSLIISSAFCPLCRLVKQRLGTVIKQFIQLGAKGSNQMVSLHPHEVPGKLWVRALNLKLGELQLYAYPDPLATRLQMPAAFPDAGCSTLPFLAGTLDDCIHSRGKCRLSDETSAISRMPLAPLLPRRILDVGDSMCNKPSSIVRLHESNPNERSFYITLSHRWGKAIPSKTTIAKLDMYKQGIRHSDLPNTFKDAIIATRNMGFKYLWIDALCIVQDDHEDWASQAPLMGAIFQNAVCTIAAHSAEHSDYGFLTAAQGTGMTEVGSCSLPGRTGINRVYLGLPRSFEGVISSSHIMQRGWIQQELILSRRLLHFSDGLAYWECPHRTNPESLGFTADLHTNSNWQMNRKRLVEEDAEKSWMEFVSHYSACELTYESDRLVAIDGVAREWMDRLGRKIAGEYRYGHFAHNASSLLWAATREVDRKKKYIPSWSWASIEGTVQFMRVRSFGSNYSNRPMPMPSITSTLDASILSAKDISSRKTCQLLVHAQTKILVMSRVKKGNFPSWWNVWAGDSPTGFRLEKPFGTVCFDHRPEEMKPPDKKTKEAYGDFPLIELHCMRISTFRPLSDGDAGTSPAFGVLLLQPERFGSSILKRVGVGMIIETNWFDDETAFQTLQIE